MEHPNSKCSKECLGCVLAWYNLGPSDDDDEDEDEEVIPDSLFDIIVPDSVDMEDKGSEVRKFDSPDVGSTLHAVIPEEEPVIPDEEVIHVEEAKCLPDSPGSIKFNNYLERFFENRKKRAAANVLAWSAAVDEGKSEKIESGPETASDIKMRKMEERFYAKRIKKSST